MLTEDFLIFDPLQGSRHSIGKFETIATERENAFLKVS
jgi:hypothetical protein